MGKLAASILSADLAHLADQVELVQPHAEIIHIDIMDGHFVPPIALGGVVVRSLRPCTDRTLHGHLMVDHPAPQFEELAEAGLDIVSFHLEAVPEPAETIGKARAAGMGVGLTLNRSTPIESVVPYLEQVDDVMLMSIEPGWSGQQLDPAVYPRLEELRTQVDRLGVPVAVEIDGGVKAENARAAVDAGATVLIAASAVFGAEDPSAAASRLAAIARGEAA
jgi:ribulose-phosphate 3-epimerase